jgi:DNA-3-methyladenine glycosylase II
MMPVYSSSGLVGTKRLYLWISSCDNHTMNLEPALQHLRKHDAVIADLIDRYPRPDIVKHTNYYQELVESIISQQLSVKAAAAIRRRFVDLFAADFPSPEDILSQDVETLRSVGLSRQKATYIQDLAAKVLDDSVRFGHLDSLSNDEIVAELTHIKGVGEWTVHMFLLFCMGRLDVLPTGDLGIKNGIAALYDHVAPVTPDTIREIAQRNQWHPYESVASLYLWQSLDNTPKASVG